MLKANKSLGQHWLKDELSLQTMVEAAGIVSTGTVVEVGPGLGYLTDKLAHSAQKVIAIEADPTLLEPLRVQFFQRPNVEIVGADILQYDLTQLSSQYKVVANIPYYITSKLLRTFLEAKNSPISMTLLVQKEVAQRIIAKPGKMSVLAFSVQYYAKTEIVSLVQKELFDPPPKVDSAIIHIARLHQPAFKADTKKLFRIVKAGFSEKRKMLRNSLSAGLHIDQSVIIQALDKAGVSNTARAQELSLTQWQNIYEQIVHMLK